MANEYSNPEGTFRVCVVGLGKIGLPLAIQYVRQGMVVIGVDTNPDVVDTIRAGTPPFPGEHLLEEGLKRALADGRFRATTSTEEAVAASNVVVVVVPLVVDHTTKLPDFAGIDGAVSAISKSLKGDTLVCFETTLPVGTTRTRFAPSLSAGSGLTLGSDLFVCFSPERVSSGQIFRDLSRYPKLVGAIDSESAVRARSFYKAALTFDDRPDLQQPNGVWDLGSSEGAELAKLAETTYRDINIAFANELAQHCDSLGIDVGPVIAAANSQPFSHIHQPGIAVGGHCIPVYPHLYLQGHPEARMPKASRAVNDRMPAYCVEALAQLLGPLSGNTVAILGLAYRGGVKETSFSGCWALIDELSRRGASIVVHDPLYDDPEIRDFGLTPYSLGTAVDGVIVQTDHAEYQTLTPRDLPGAKGLIDGRSVIRAIDLFAESGCQFAVLGRRSSVGTVA